MIVLQKSDRDDLLKCLTEGHVLLLTDIDVEALSNDSIYMPVILACEKFHQASVTFKLSVCFPPLPKLYLDVCNKPLLLQ